MHTLTKLTAHGSLQSRATNWMRQAGYILAETSDGKSHFLGDISLNEALSAMKRKGLDCSKVEQGMADACKPFEPSQTEQAATEYQHGLGWEVPVALGKWDFSVTFGRWGRLVTFADGQEIFTYPTR